mmetsp:Transcript_10162/g.20333  ORF Transcript_10162/g.20333 Transcript_10162/m.20333 type:complete len:264 (-) Transcript_10162:57-848(-)
MMGCSWACANRRASFSVCSGTSNALTSSMSALSLVPAYTMSSGLLASCSFVGSLTNFPFTSATRTHPKGPSHGTSEECKAAELALAAKDTGGSGCVWRSNACTEVVSWVSEAYRGGNKGRRHRSTQRPVKISLSLFACSRRFGVRGMRPDAAGFSLYSTLKGVPPSPPSPGLPPVRSETTVASTTVPPSFPTTAPCASPASFPCPKVTRRSPPPAAFVPTAYVSVSSHSPEEARVGAGRAARSRGRCANRHPRDLNIVNSFSF